MTTIEKSVLLLDLFCKIYCREEDDYKKYGDLKFRCKECPFEQEEKCLVKVFKCEKLPDYKDFGSMGDL